MNIMDAWVLKPSHEHRYHEVVKQYGSIANSPYGESAIVFTLETYDGCWIATSAYKSNACSKKGRTFGPVKFVLMDGFRGRFGGLLPVKKTNASRMLARSIKEVATDIEAAMRETAGKGASEEELAELDYLIGTMSHLDMVDYLFKKTGGTSLFGPKENWL